MSQPDPGAPSLGRRDLFVVLAAGLLYSPFLFLGPGPEVEAFRVIGAGLRIVHGEAYVPSRYPGYLVHEAATGALWELGGSVLTNLGTLVMSLLALTAFLGMCAAARIEHRRWLAGVLLLHPVYWIGSTATLDDVWALGLGLAGLWGFFRGRSVLAGLLLGLAIGTRLGSLVFVGALAVAWLWTRRERWRELAAACATAAVVGAALYVPSFLHAEATLGFLTFSREPWSAWDYVARIGYKNVYFWGLPGFLALAFLVPRWIRGIGGVVSRRTGSGQVGAARVPPRLLAILSLVVILGAQIQFARIPQSYSYLLPMLPFVLFLLGLAPTVGRPAMAVVMVAVASYSALNVNIARPDVPHHATSADLGLWLEPGLVVRSVRSRTWLEECKRREGIDTWLPLHPSFETVC